MECPTKSLNNTEYLTSLRLSMKEALRTAKECTSNTTQPEVIPQMEYTVRHPSPNAILQPLMMHLPRGVTLYPRVDAASNGGPDEPQSEKVLSAEPLHQPVLWRAFPGTPSADVPPDVNGKDNAIATTKGSRSD